MTRQEKINQLAKAIKYYLDHKPEYGLDAVRVAARRFAVSPKLLQRALRMMRETYDVTRTSKKRN